MPSADEQTYIPRKQPYTLKKSILFCTGIGMISNTMDMFKMLASKQVDRDNPPGLTVLKGLKGGKGLRPPAGMWLGSGKVGTEETETEELQTNT